MYEKMKTHCKKRIREGERNLFPVRFKDGSNLFFFYEWAISRDRNFLRAPIATSRYCMLFWILP